MTKQILMVLTSHDQLGETGRKNGFWLDPSSDAPDAQTDDMRRFRDNVTSTTTRRLASSYSTRMTPR
ncbi:hypothetical protein BH09GEM1_BH09GEM1_09880 [soil metagenome]